MLTGNHVMVGVGAHIRPKSSFEGYNRVHAGAYFCGEIGYASYIGSKSVVIGKIGRFCSIAEDVHFLTKTHPVKGFVSTHPVFYSLKKQCGITYTGEQKFEEEPLYNGETFSIIVGNDVYIGYGAIIIGPCSIGDGAVIAAGSVVTKDVEPYAIVGGNPARLIKYRFEQDDIEFLCGSVKWWNRDIKWIESHSEYMESLDRVKELFKQNPEEDLK